MIDYGKLQEAYDNDGIYALQLEVGDVCYQNCIYCYMNALPDEKNTLSDEDIEDILHDACDLGITAVEWLGGEPLLRDDIFRFMALARNLGLRNNIWTGGLPLRKQEVVKRVIREAGRGLIAFHISTVDPELYDELHPGRSPEDLQQILAGVKDVLAEGYSPGQMLNSVTFTGLQPVEDMIATIDYFETEFNIKTSLNVYHTYLRPDISDERLEEFIPERRAVARVAARVAEQWGREQLPMNCVNKEYCSATVAVLADGSVTPCATIREKKAANIHRTGSFREIINQRQDALIFKDLKSSDNLPEGCAECFLADQCWGCRSRSFAATGDKKGKDPRCFRSR